MQQCNAPKQRSCPVELRYIIDYFTKQQADGSVSTIPDEMAAILTCGRVFTDEQMKSFSPITVSSIERFFGSVNNPSQWSLDSTENDQIRIAQLKSSPKNTVDLRERLDSIKSELIGTHKFDEELAGNVISLLRSDIQSNVPIRQCGLRMHKHQIVKGIIETEPMTDQNMNEVFAQGDTIVRVLNADTTLGSDYETVAKYEVKRGDDKPHKTLFKCGLFVTIELSYIHNNTLEKRFVVADPYTKTVQLIVNETHKLQ